MESSSHVRVTEEKEPRTAQAGRWASGANFEMAKRLGKRLSSRRRGAMFIELEEAPDRGTPIFGHGVGKDLRRGTCGIR